MRTPPPALALALAAVASFALAGCVTSDQPAQDNLIGDCPDWQQGPGQFDGHADLAGDHPVNATVAPANMTLGRRSLDLYRIRITRIAVDGGRAELHAWAANGSRAFNIYDYRPNPFHSVPFLSLHGGANDTGEYDVLLSPPAQGEAPQPTALQLDWTFVPSGAGGSATIDYTVTFHYRVCGVNGLP